MLYSFTKNFGCPSEAIREILNLSYSLRESPLRFFGDSNTLEEFEGWIKTLKEEGWAFPMAKPIEKGFVFCFSTSNRINNFGLMVEEGLANACYAVVSEHSIRDSPIANVVLDAGWTLMDCDSAEQERLMEEEDKRREEEMRRCVSRGALPGLYFREDFFPLKVVNRKGEAVIYQVPNYSIATDPRESLAALKLCPDLKEQVRVICKRLLQEKIESPGLHEFNWGFYQCSDWFEKKFRSYQDGVRKVLEACE